VHSVVGNDTYESITDYNSASPHVKTLEKFQELGIGLSRQDQKLGLRTSNMSAMEPGFDFTDKATAPPPELSTGANRRWKYQASHVRTMTPGDFQGYVREKVQSRKDEFMALLRARHHRQQMKIQTERDRELLNTQDASVDPAAFTARSAYVQWVERMSPALLIDYLTNRDQVELGSKSKSGALAQTTASATAQTDALPSETAQQEMEQELSNFAGNASFTFSTAIRTLLRQNWWTAELDEDTSLHGELLRLKVAEIPIPKRELPRPNHPSLENAHAASWLKFLGLAEKYEKEFLRAWSTQAWDVNGKEFESYLQYLRKDITLGSQLNGYIREFLDMPPIQRQGSKDRGTAFTVEESAFTLTTHPSAGLSYLRTNNILRNHPILGPQRSDPPVKARVIAPLTDKMLYGLAGFVGEGDQGRLEMGFDKTGGTKVDRDISKVYVNGEGSINIIHRSRRDREAGEIRDGKLEPSMEEQVAKAKGSELTNLLREGQRPSAAAPKARPLDNTAVDQLKQLGRMLDRERGLKPAQS
jgi:hypothetical protein